MSDKMNKLALFLIEKYQKRGGGAALFIECNFDPSCSHYSKECYKKHSFFKATQLTINRIKRCNCKNINEKILDPVP